MLITSPQNPRIKDAVRLRDRRHREKRGRMLIDGARELRRAMAAGVQLFELFLCESLCHTADAQAILAGSVQADCEVLYVTEPVFEKLAFGNRTEGVLGVAAMPTATLEEVTCRLALDQKQTSRACATAGLSSRAEAVPKRASREDAPLIAVLEAVEKPGNVGAVLRSADAAGIAAVILADPQTDLFNPNAIRASLGTIFTVPVAAASNAEVLAWLRQHRFSIVAARVDGSVPYTEIDYRRPTAVVLGSEADGLSDAWTAADIQAIRLPMLGIADSLNVSVTAAVVFYEALRQRDAK